MKITIFGLAGTGKTTAGKMLAEKLGYEFMSTGNIFRQMAADLNLSLNEFEKITETDEKYDRELDEVRVTSYGQNNNDFVLESRLAWHFVPDSIKIRLFCEEDERIKRVSFRESKDVELVRKETQEREDSIYKRYKKLYGIENINDLSNFDLNIDTTKNDANKVVEIIMNFIKNDPA